MKRAPSGDYQKIDEVVLQSEVVSAWISNEARDSEWDKFLQEIPSGQFQQSSIWAQAKWTEGWRPVRLLFTANEVIVGGFQVLMRSSWWGKMGYVSKGPVVLPDNGPLADYAAQVLATFAQRKWLWAIVVQPPDLCEQMSRSLAARGFLPNVLIGVNEATWVNDVAGGFHSIEGKMNKTTRNQIRQAKRQKVIIREGDRDDISKFFDLMLSTCRRQGVEPNPYKKETLVALWDAASPSGSIRLTFAQHEGDTLAGLLCIVFGQTVSAWKKGWTSADRHLHPNDLLTCEVLKWANSRNYKVVDFAALDVEIALQLFRDQPLSPKQQKTRDLFNVRFGGRPMLLPEARVFFPNPITRWAYRFILQKKIERTQKFRESVAQARLDHNNSADSRRGLSDGLR